MQLLVKADDILSSLTVLRGNTGQETSTGSYNTCCESLPNQAFLFLLEDKGAQKQDLIQLLECKMLLKRNSPLLKYEVIWNKKFTIL